MWLPTPKDVPEICTAFWLHLVAQPCLQASFLKSSLPQGQGPVAVPGGAAGVSAGVGAARQPLRPGRCFACAPLLGVRPRLGSRERSLPSVLTLARPAGAGSGCRASPCLLESRIPAALLPGNLCF